MSQFILPRALYKNTSPLPMCKENDVLPPPQHNFPSIAYVEECTQEIRHSLSGSEETPTSPFNQVKEVDIIP